MVGVRVVLRVLEREKRVESLNLKWLAPNLEKSRIFVSERERDLYRVGVVYKSTRLQEQARVLHATR